MLVGDVNMKCNKTPLWKKVAPRVILPPNTTVPDKKKDQSKKGCRKQIKSDDLS
jgi:hypothetical protein